MYLFHSIADVILVQSTCKPVNNNLMELLIMIDAFRRASAGRTVLSVSHRIYENLGGRTVKIEPQSM